MLEKISKIGKSLDKKELQSINGGIHICNLDGCPDGYVCMKYGCIIL